MAIGLLSDVDVEGQFEVVIGMCQRGEWAEYWDGAGAHVWTFEELGLPFDAKDREIWRACQRENILLITANRNERSPDSLGVTIRKEGHPGSLPVLTLSDADRVMCDNAYARRVADKLMQMLYDLERYRGTGRVFLP